MDLGRYQRQPRIPDTGPARGDPLKTDGDVASHLQRSEGVGREVRVTKNMHVSSAPVGRYRYVQQFDPRVSRHVSPTSFGHVAISGPIEHGRSPELQVEAGRDEQISPLDRQREARLRTHEVCVLVRSRNGAHVDLGTPDLLHEICVDWKRHNDSDGIRLCGAVSHHQPESHDYGNGSQHRVTPSVRFVFVRTHREREPKRELSGRFPGVPQDVVLRPQPHILTLPVGQRRGGQPRRLGGILRILHPLVSPWTCPDFVDG